MLENLLSYDPEVDQDLTFMSLFMEVTSENGIDELILLTKDELLIHHHQLECASPALSDLDIADIQCLKFYLKHSRKWGLLSQ